MCIQFPGHFWRASYFLSVAVGDATARKKTTEGYGGAKAIGLLPAALDGLRAGISWRLYRS